MLGVEVRIVPSPVKILVRVSAIGLGLARVGVGVRVGVEVRIGQVLRIR